MGGYGRLIKGRAFEIMPALAEDFCFRRKFGWSSVDTDYVSLLDAELDFESAMERKERKDVS